MRLYSILALAAFTAHPNVSQAEALTGNALYESCTANREDEAAKFTYCVGYITGVGDGLIFGGVTSILRLGLEDVNAAEASDIAYQTMGYCAPSAVTAYQTIDVVIKFLADNPAIRHESARGLILAAYREAFPCK